MLKGKKTLYGHEDSERAIIYSGVKDTVVLRPEQFDSEEEFFKWKKWMENEKADPGRIAQTTLWETMDYVPQEELPEAARLVSPEEVLPLAKRYSTPKQFRRLWLYAAEKKTLREIGEMEHISIQAARKSIVSAKKRILKVWKSVHKMKT